MPAPTHPHRVFRNPLKVGGQGDEERSRMNIKGALAQVKTIKWKQARDEAERNKITIILGRYKCSGGSDRNRCPRW